MLNTGVTAHLIRHERHHGVWEDTQKVRRRALVPSCYALRLERLP